MSCSVLSDCATGILGNRFDNPSDESYIEHKTKCLYTKVEIYCASEVTLSSLSYTSCLAGNLFKPVAIHTNRNYHKIVAEEMVFVLDPLLMENNCRLSGAFHSWVANSNIVS